MAHDAVAVVGGVLWRQYFLLGTSALSAIEMPYETVLYKFTIDTDIDIQTDHADMCRNR